MDRVSSRRSLRALLLGGAAAASVLVLAGPAAPAAHAHASFLESRPGPGATVGEARRLTLEYTEPLSERLSRATLVSADGDREMPATVRTIRGRRLVIAPRGNLPQGRYRIDWRAVSIVDGHIKEGSVSFGVGVPVSGAGMSLEESPIAGGRWPRIVVRAVLYIALLFFAGGVLISALLSPGHPGRWLVPPPAREALAATGGDPHELERRIVRHTVAAGWLAAGSALAVALVETWDAAGGLTAEDLADFLLSNLPGLARVVTVLAIVGAVASVRRRPRLAAALTALTFAAIAVSGHANAADPRPVALLSDWAHLLAGAVWIGGIAQLTLAWLPAMRSAGGLRRTLARSLLPRFGKVALPAFLLVAATGLTNALVELGRPAELVESGYGRVLAAKIVLVAAIALASYLHAFRLRPRLVADGITSAAVERRHWRLIRSEPLLGVAVVAAAALLVAFPLPPSQIAASRAIPPCNPCPLAKPAPGELAVAERAGRLTVAAWMRRDGNSVRGTLRVLDQYRQPVRARIALEAAVRQRGCGKGCLTFRLAEGTPRLSARVTARGRGRRVELPAHWRYGADGRARRLLARAQRTMRARATMRQVETVQSIRGGPAKVEFRFQAPDRVGYRNEAGSEVVMIGRRQWFRNPGTPWQSQRMPPTLANRPEGRFRWTVYAPSARLLAIESEGGRRTADLAFLDHGYPVWYRLRMDLATGRVRRASLLTPANRIEDRYSGFDTSIEIEPPPAALPAP